MGKVINYNHIGLVTENFDQIIDFYCNVFGCKVTARFRVEDKDSRTTLNLTEMIQDIATIENEAGTFAMEILYYITPTAPNPLRPSDFAVNDLGTKHFSVSVDDIDEVYQKVLEYGGRSISVPVIHPQGYAFFLLRDPDGNLCEITQCS